jgi:hypothetical protein
MAPVRGDGGGEMNDNPPLIISIVVLVMISCFASNRIGAVGAINNMQKEAVIKGHAEWVADTNGKPQFKWKECK